MESNGLVIIINKITFPGGDPPHPDSPAVAISSATKHEAQTPAHPLPRYLAAIISRLPVVARPSRHAHVTSRYMQCGM